MVDNLFLLLVCFQIPYQGYLFEIGKSKGLDITSFSKYDIDSAVVEAPQ